MASFQKDIFRDHGGGYISYNGEFVARFKHQPSAVGSFKTFLIKHFSTEEYFGLLKRGVAPLIAVESKGYVLPHLRKWVREGIITQARVDELISHAKEVVNEKHGG